MGFRNWAIFAILVQIVLCHSVLAADERIAVASLAPAPGDSASQVDPLLNSTQVKREKIAPTFAEGFFRVPQTVEAHERLAAMDKVLEEKTRFQLQGQYDLLSYQQANQLLARWYLKEVLRSHLRELIGQSRSAWRRERDHDAIKDRAALAAAPPPRVTDGRAPASAEPRLQSAQESVPEARPSRVGNFVSEATEFVERLTNDGIWVGSRASTSKVNSFFHFEVQNATLRGHVSSILMELEMNMRVFDKEDPIPFMHGGGGSGDRVSIASGRSFHVLGFDTSVGYNILHPSLGCAVSRQLARWLGAYVTRSWRFGQDTPTSQVGVNVLATF